MPCHRSSLTGIAVNSVVLGAALEGCVPDLVVPVVRPNRTSTAAPRPVWPCERADQTLTPAEKNWSVRIPPQFITLRADSPELRTLPTMVRAVRQGSGALAIDGRSPSTSTYRATVGGLCTVVDAVTEQRLAEEMRDAVSRIAVAALTPHYSVRSRSDDSPGTIVGRFQMMVCGDLVHVTQLGTLTAPGEACILTIATDAPLRDAEDESRMRKSFSLCPPVAGAAV